MTTDEDYQARREELVDQLGRVRDLSRSTIEAMKAVPRHEFVPPDKRDQAYRDQPLPIGNGQTISAPHMVAVMVDLLDVSRGDEVLEIGAGCGYHAAVTAEVVGPENVYSVEYVDELAEEARKNLANCGYGRASVRQGDGHDGWPEHAPYDAAYLTCAAPAFPDAVVEQVRAGGELLGPIGRGRQELIRAEKTAEGLDREQHGAVRFVSMQG